VQRVKKNKSDSFVNRQFLHSENVLLNSV